MEKFWCLQEPESNAKEAEFADGMDWEAVKCSAESGHQHPGRRITALSVELHGKRVDDFVWTCLSDCLVQDRVLELFKDHDVTGYEVKPKPVKAVFKRNQDHEPPRLWELVVTGWGGMANPESGVKLTQCCDACGLLKYSRCTIPAKLIDSSQWDGSDLFILWPLPKFIFVTDRIAEIIRRNRLTGPLLVDPKSMDLIHTFMPGRLSYWMPDARARQLGEPLGIY